VSDAAAARTAALEPLAREAGFDWFGVAAAAGLDEARARLEQWLAEGRHGSMEWLARDPARRADPRLVLAECRSVVIVGMNYLRDAPPRRGSVVDPPAAGMGRISRYARTRDYHRVLEGRLRRLARAIDVVVAPGSTTRAYVDYGPVLERDWAARAGIGFIGKHTLLIHPRQGSFHFLAALLTTAELAPTAALPHADGCGDCRRCIDACPTGAITEPWRLDARRCLSYLTIEHPGPPGEAHDPKTVAGQVFGCDICQDVCPYNQSRAAPADEPSPLGPPIVAAEVPLATLIAAPDEWLAALGDVATPLRRAGAEALRRNALIAAASAPTPETCRAAAAVAEDSGQPEWMRQLARRAAQGG
jgi:epoxyqueuosine reductase